MDSPQARRKAENRPRILVVDDDEMVGEVMVESIRADGHDVDYCEDGAEALERSRTKTYDLMVTDMRLPGLDGLSLLRKLRATNIDTDVIVITGYGSIENAVECMKAGALDYLIKPFTVELLQIAVRKALEHRDLRQRAKEREFYRELSYVDALTGVYNRRYFDEALGAEIEKALLDETDLVLFIIDIDDFKGYNDLHGHQKGDEVLGGIGRMMKSIYRASDIITRYGGEEFAIILPGAGKAQAPELAGRVINHMRDSSFEGEELLPLGRLTVSVGVACFPDDAHTAEELVRCADAAMYVAKKCGKNRVKLYGSP